MKKSKNMIAMSTKKVFAFFLILCGVAFFLFHNNSKTITASDNLTQNLTCIEKTAEKIVRGNSLTGLIENGETVKINYGYYNCNEIKRNDIVIYNYAGIKNPLIKIVKALPKDNFSLQKNQSNWHIIINDKTAQNSEGMPYILDKQAEAMLSLYEKDYHGIIPQNTYLILGNLAEGSLDSSRFGLIGKKNILGKVELNNVTSQ